MDQGLRPDYACTGWLAGRMGTTCFFGWNLNLDWSTLLPSASGKIAQDGYGLFWLSFIMMLDVSRAC